MTTGVCFTFSPGLDWALRFQVLVVCGASAFDAVGAGAVAGVAALFCLVGASGAFADAGCRFSGEVAACGVVAGVLQFHSILSRPQS
jgi:hypothetical protein